MTSTIKVNNIQNQCGQNIINENSNTITIGASGDTIALASGASQSGFGREGSVNWQTGSIKTTTFTAVSGEGYFVNTSGGVVTANLPAGVAGAIVAFADYTRTFGDNKLTVSPNGSDKIGGFNTSFDAEVNGQALTLVFVDSTEGWVNVQNAEDTETGVPPFITATGGTITTCGNDKIHTFTGPGTFTVTKIATCCAAVNNLVSYMVVAGGGASNGIGVNNSSMGGGGAGGFRELKSPSTPGYTASPLDGYPSAPNRITVTAQGYPITVGAGGTGGVAGLGNQGSSGSVSTFSTISSAGGGNGSGYESGSWVAGSTGGSGGGGGYPNQPGMAGNTPPTTPPQGNPGGNGIANPGGCGSAGGGGAGGAGANATAPQNGGAGGIGAGTAINPAVGTPGPSGSLKYFSGGGGGAPYQVPGTVAGGAGGGGNGAVYPPGGTGSNGTGNTGGGAGGTSGTPGSTHAGASGGSGIVVIRYRFQ